MYDQKFIDKASEELMKKDPVLGKIIPLIKIPPYTPVDSYFVALTESIISQQLSVKAADTIWGRVQDLFSKRRVTPEGILDIPDETLRGAGLSYAKIKYIKDLATKTLESGILFEQFEMMTEEEIITELVKVKGIGRWTAEMFLMFAMGKPDVFSYGDLGLRNGIQKLYGLKKEPTEKQAKKITDAWKPYRTLGCRYIWKSLEL